MKKFLILNPEGTVVLGSYIAEEKDETSKNRSHTLCPPHTVHYELPDGLSEHEVIVGVGELAPSYVRIISPAVEEIRDEDDEIIVEAAEAVVEVVPAVTGLRLIFNQEKADAVLVSARSEQLAKIRTIRDQKLLENDREWLIAAKQKLSTVNIEIVAQMLRDLPEHAGNELAEMTTLEEINGYNPFEV